MRYRFVYYDNLTDNTKKRKVMPLFTLRVMVWLLVLLLPILLLLLFTMGWVVMLALLGGAGVMTLGRKLRSIIGRGQKSEPLNHKKPKDEVSFQRRKVEIEDAEYSEI
jgi:hypothetical protein